MATHVNEVERLTGGIQRSFHHSFRRAHKRVDGPVGGGSGVDIQQGTSGCAADGRRDGINDLKVDKRGQNPSIWDLKSSLFSRK